MPGDAPRFRPSSEATYAQLFTQQCLYRVIVSCAGFVFLAALGALGGTQRNVRWIWLVLAVQIVLSWLFTAAHRRFGGSNRRWYRGTMLVDIVSVTLCIHFLAREFVPYGITCYAFFIVLTAASASYAECVRTAVLCAVIFGALLLLKAAGIVPTPESAFVPLPPIPQGVVTMMFLVAFLATVVATAGHSAALVRREREAAATANRELAEQAEELRAFVYTVTHDLKNPISAILLTADMLLEREGGTISDESREDLRRIMRTADGTEDMIRDLMGLFRITSTPEASGWVDLDSVVARALDTIAPQAAAKGVHVHAGRLPRVWGQADKLGHVVGNLLTNAIKYVPADRGEIEVAGRQEDGHVVFHVRDNGIGIPADYHRNIFELFGRVPDHVQQANGHVGGTGVGLAIVRRIVEAHHGAVWVESQPGSGSCFYVRLPAGAET